MFRISSLVFRIWFLLAVGSCIHDRPLPEHIPWYWDTAEYAVVANGREIGSFLFHAEWMRQEEGPDLLVVRDHHVSQLWDLTADTHVTLTCAQTPGEGYLHYSLTPLTIQTKTIFTHGDNVSQYVSSEILFKDSVATYTEGDQIMDVIFPPEALIEPLVRILVPTLPRTVGATIVVPVTYYDWKRKEIRGDQRIVFKEWGWLPVHGRTMHLARFDRMEGDEVFASYWVDRDNRLVMATLGRNTYLILKQI